MFKAMAYVLAFLMTAKETLALENLQLKAKDNKAQTWMEYGMIIGGIILVIVVVIGLFGDKLQELFSDITGAMSINDSQGGGNGW